MLTVVTSQCLWSPMSGKDLQMKKLLEGYWVSHRELRVNKWGGAKEGLTLLRSSG